MLPIVVLKFGSSVLRSPKDLPVVVDEVYRHLREGKRVLAIVSAFAGETDRLFSVAPKVLGPKADPHAIARFVTRGEWHSSAELMGALMSAGVAACLVGPHGISLRVEGGALEADPVSIDLGVLHSAWETSTTLVMPGFVGVDAQDRICLLGRGGSDLSALFVAGALGAPCHLVKDVPGVFNTDPALDSIHARRYALIPWQDAIAVAGPLIQPKALAYAKRHRISFSVSRAHGTLETLVTDAPQPEWGASTEGRSSLKVALLGLGTVGGGVYERLWKDPERFDVVAVVTRNVSKAIAKGVPKHIATADFDRALSPDVDVVIECMGGIEPAACLIDAALERGKCVVTANKAVVAACWDDLSSFVVGPNRRLWYSAAVGGAVPVLETLTRLAPRITEVRGVISGTCNYVLDAVASGMSFAAAVKAAQHAGYAEADPERDLSGQDTADKLSLIAQAAFDVFVPSAEIPTRGVALAINSECRLSRLHVWRLVARATNTQGCVNLSIAPELINRSSFLGQTTDAENRIEIVLDDRSIVRLAGQGAGRWPTTIAVMGDLYEVARRKTLQRPELIPVENCATPRIAKIIAPAIAQGIQ